MSRATVVYGKMEHEMLHNSPSLDLSSIILLCKKKKKNVI